MAEQVTSMSRKITFDRDESIDLEISTEEGALVGLVRALITEEEKSDLREDALSTLSYTSPGSDKSKGAAIANEEGGTLASGPGGVFD